MTLRLRCIRCGEWDDMDPLATFAPGTCRRCRLEAIRPVDTGMARIRRLHRFEARYQRNIAGHPTYRALTAALEAMEAVPRGPLVTNVAEEADRV